MRWSIAVAVVLAATSVRAARADGDDDGPPGEATPAPTVPLAPTTAPLPPSTLVTPIVAPAPPRRTPFDRGRFWISAGGGSQSLLGNQYFEIGAGVGYFVLDGVEVSLSGLYELGNGPSIEKLSPGIRYLAQPLVGKWPIIPYVGGFYNHWFIGGYPDEDTIGARAGFVYISGSIAIGLGIAIEHEVSACTTGCTWEYPDFSIGLAL